MKKLRNYLIGVDQGNETLFSDFEDDGPMWAETGPREIRRAVVFSEPYRSPPVVQVAMSMFDMDNRANQRADIQAENITAIGFDIVFRTWADTRLARVRATWTAIGELPHEDDWHISE